MLLPKRFHRHAVRVSQGDVGLTDVRAIVSRRDGRGKAVRVRFLVDTGALYSVLPPRVWHALGLRPARTAEFSLADGSSIARGVSECRFTLAGMSATSPVVLGEADEGPLLGAVTLETLGLMVNPLSRKVYPMRLTLKVIQLPYNLAMPEAYEHPTQEVDGERVCALEAARRLGIVAIASASILQGQLSRRLPTAVDEALPGLASAAARALQFVRSTPGVTAALVGMSRREHVEQNLAVAHVEPAPAGVDSLFARR